MINIENIVLVLLFGWFVFNFMTIIGGIGAYFMQLQDIKMYLIKREDLEEDIHVIVKPYEAFLLAKGFEYVGVIEHNSMIVKFDAKHHVFSYYHTELGVHANIQTTPLLGHLTPATIEFVTFYESYRMALTHDCYAYNLIVDDNVYLFDHYFGSLEKAFESHLIDREIESETMVKKALSQEGYLNYSQFMFTQTVEEMQGRNILVEGKGWYKFTFFWDYWKYTHNVMKGYKKAKKVLAEKDAIYGAVSKNSTTQSLYQNSEKRTLYKGVEEKPKTSTKEGKIRTFIISGLSFVLLFGLLGIPWSALPMLLLILLIHELGHFFAMRFFGYTDTSIFFIPLFGAAAKGEKEYVNSFEEYIVFLAGPVPGMIISLVLAYLMWNSPELRENALLQEYALMSFFLNYINLLPIYPLDGGRVIQTLLFTRYPKLQYYFFLVSLMVIIFSALLLQSILLGIFALILFLSINHNANLARLVEKLKAQNSDEHFEERVIDIVTTDKKFAKISLPKKNSLVKQAVKLLKAQKPSKLLIFLGMFFYLLLLLPPLFLYIMIGGIG